MKSTAILILAAGSASRMGKTKQLLPYRETTLLGHSISQALASKADSVYCVLGAQAELIEKEMHSKVKFIINENWEYGLSSSIAAGIRYLKTKDCNSVLVMLADQPKIDSVYLNLLLDYSIENPTKCIASGYGAKNGVPAVFPKSYFDILEKLNGDQGAQQLLNSETNVVITINAKDKVEDIDTPEDYNRLLKK